jgi:hypothetical protein
MKVGVVISNETMENGLFVNGESQCDWNGCDREAGWAVDGVDDEFFACYCSAHLIVWLASWASDLIREIAEGKSGE